MSLSRRSLLSVSTGAMAGLVCMTAGANSRVSPVRNSQQVKVLDKSWPMPSVLKAIDVWISLVYRRGEATSWITNLGVCFKRVHMRSFLKDYVNENHKFPEGKNDFGMVRNDKGSMRYTISVGVIDFDVAAREIEKILSVT